MSTQHPGIELDDFGVPYHVLPAIQVGGKALKAPNMYSAPAARIEAIFSLARDPAMRSMMRNAAAAKSGPMIDVGANIGQSLVKWASVDETRGYIGFEPNSASALQCGLLIHLNQLRNHRLFPVGISDRFSAVSLHVNGLLDPSASFVEGFRPQNFFRRSVDGVTVRGDDMMEVLGVAEIAFLKIDVEGAELEVFKSFQKTLEKLRPLITFEVLPHFLLATGEVLPEDQVEFRRHRYAEIESLLKTLNYKLWNCTAGSAPQQVNTIQPGPPGTETAIKNFLAVAAEFETELLSRWN